MPRRHRTTHPVIGLATWRQIQAAALRIYKAKGQRVCTWCHSLVPAGKRTRCGKATCREMIWQAQSWSRCRTQVLKKDHYCRGVTTLPGIVLANKKGILKDFKVSGRCGKPAVEVDHIIPVSLGGSSDQNNLRGLCHECHLIATQRLRQLKKAYLA